MTVYAEYLFLENFVTGVLILHFTGKLCGHQISGPALLRGGILCGLYAFVLFCDAMSAVVSIACKLLFSFLVVVITFGLWPRREALPGKKEVREFGPWMKQTARAIFLFYFVSFVMGGVTIAAMYFFASPGVAGNGNLYVHGGSYINILLGILLAWWSMELLIEFVRKRKNAVRDLRQVRVVLAGQEFSFTALVDTANFLREPLTGKPVAVISPSAAEPMASICPKERLCVIPYRGIGRERGLLPGFRADRALVGKNWIERPVFAVCEREFQKKSLEESYQILLHRELAEGGIAADG